MRNLLRANVNRCKHDLVFVVCVLSLFIFGMISVVTLYQEKVNLLNESTADKVFGAFVIPVCILLNLMCCLFWGEEFDGTIRNKLSVGHTRTHIYAAQLLACFGAGIILSIAYLIPASALGCMLLGGFETNFSSLLCYYISSLSLVLACVSIYCVLITLVGKKGLGTALSFLVMLLTIWIGRQVQNLLTIPQKTFHPFVENGEVTYAYIDNPLYPTGRKRRMLEWINEYLPSNQSWQITFFPQNAVSCEHALKLAAFSLSLAAIMFVIGILVFQKKDLR